MNRFILAFLWFVLVTVETDGIQDVAISHHDLAAKQSADASADTVVGTSEVVGKTEDVDLERSLAEKGSPRRRRRRRDRRRRRRRRFRRRRRRRRRRRTPAPTTEPTPLPTPVPTPAPTPVPTQKAGKGKGGSLFEVEDEDYAEDVVPPSTPEETAQYFGKVHEHLQDTNKMEGSELEGDPILIFCNGQAYEMDPSAGVKTPETLAAEWGYSLNDGNEPEISVAAVSKGINLVMSAPRIETIASVLKTATVPAEGKLTIYFVGQKEPDSEVRLMNAEKAETYGLSVKWLQGMDLASL